MAVVQLNEINKVFAGEYLLRDITFSVDEKDRIGLVGLNGAGKTTLLKILLGQEEHDENIETMKRGEIIKKRGMKIGYLSQHFDLHDSNTIFKEMLSTFSFLTEIYEKIELLNHEVAVLKGDELEKKMKELSELQSKYEHEEGYSIEYKIKQVLNGLGFTPEEYELKIKGLSGGQKGRVALGKLLAESPELLILDEPTNHLDINAIEWLENYLKNYSKAFILVSHDRYFLNSVTNRILEVENRKMKSYSGNFSAYIDQKELALKSDLRAYEKEQEKIKITEEFIRRYKAGIKCKQARGREKILNRMERMDDPDVGKKNMSLRFKVERATSDNIVKGRRISKSYGDKVILDNIDFEIYRGERIGIIGKNGTGKTTLLKIIAGVDHDKQGELFYGTRLDLGYYDQHHSDLNIKNTIFEELISNFKISDEQARSLAGGFMFSEDDAFKEIGKLSGGERARVSLMKLMLKKPNFLIMDEPTNHLDIYSREVLEEALEDYDGTLVVVSHDRYFLESSVDKIYEIQNGKLIVFDGNYDDYKKKQEAVTSEKDEKSEVALSYEEQKKAKNRINSLEKKIQESEKKIGKLESEKEKIMAEHEAAGKKNDYSLLMELQEKADAKDEEMLLVMEEWENMEAELADLKSKV
jgi:ATP-binding cassette, subfamily F, member 3